MSLPTSREIERKAFEAKIQDDLKQGLPSLSPEREELSEGGYLVEAQRALMSENKAWREEQLRYLSQLASESGYVAIPQREYDQAFISPKLSRSDIRNLTVHYISTSKKMGRKYSIEEFSNLFRKDGNGDYAHYRRKIDQSLMKPSRVLSTLPPIGPLPVLKRAKKRRREKLSKVEAGRNGRKSRKWKGRKYYALDDATWGIKK